MVPPSVLRSQDDDLQCTTFCSIWLHHTRKSLHVAVFNWEYVYAVKTANLRREVKKAETQQRLHKASWPFQYHLKHTHKVLSGNTCLNSVWTCMCVTASGTNRCHRNCFSKFGVFQNNFYCNLQQLMIRFNLFIP